MVKYRHRWVPKMASPPLQVQPLRKIKVEPWPPLPEAGPAKIPRLQRNSAAAQGPGGSPSPPWPAGARAPTRRPNTDAHHFGEFWVLALFMHDINFHANFHDQCGSDVSFEMVKSKIHPRNAEISTHGVRR